MSLREQILSGLYWGAGLRFLGQLITWTIAIVVMRLLSPQDYGLMGMAGIFITFLAMVNELGLGAVLIQKRDIDEDMVRQIFGLLLIINFALFSLSLTAAPLVAVFFEEQRLVPLIRLISIQFIMASFVIIPQSIIDREMLFREKAIVDLVSAIAGSLATLALALSGWGVWSLVWGSLTISLCRTVGLNLIRPYLQLPKFSFKGAGRAVSFGAYVTISRILWTLYTQADIIIIGKVLGKNLLGFYSVALNLASLPMQKVSGIINQVAFPAFASVQSDLEQVASHFLKAVRIMSFIAFPVLWGISSIAPDMVNLILGEKWSLAIVPLQILSLVIPVRMVNNLMSPTLIGIGRADVLFLNVVAASLTIPIGFLIGSYWGIVGVSLIWVTIFPVVFLFNLSRTVKVLNIALLNVIKAMAWPFCAASIMYITVMVTRIIIGTVFSQVVSFLLIIITGGLVYLVTIWTVNKEGCREAVELIKK
ncbi:MAG: lipopolysaccharide biosynthesis protein [Tissierellales bacterium]|nr:lipopolysaccharide biosynthesis protein [Tissierellales bacterium]